MPILLLLCFLLSLSGCSEIGGQPDGEASAAPLFQIDRTATGPLTLAELQVRLPAHLLADLSDEGAACYLNAVERRAQEAGDPARIDPSTLPYWGDALTQEDWLQHDAATQRLLLAQAILSWALMDC